MLSHLIYKLNFIIGMYVSEKYLWGFGTIPGFRHPLGILESILLGYVGITVVN